MVVLCKIPMFLQIALIHQNEIVYNDTSDLSSPLLSSFYCPLLYSYNLDVFFHYSLNIRTVV